MVEPMRTPNPTPSPEALNGLTVEQMTPTEARVLTDEVVADAERLDEKVLRLYEGGAHLALGYSSWHAYATAELQLGKTRSYELLDHGRITRQIADSGIPERPNAGQAVELLRAPEPERVEVWREAVTRTDGRPTAAVVRTVREERAPARLAAVPTAAWSEPTTPAEVRGSEFAQNYVNSSRDVQVARYRHEFAKALSKADDMLTFTPEDVAEQCDEQLVQSIRLLHRQIGDYLGRVEQARTGLRVIQGEGR